ncbi:MAG: hypothetical protein IK120_07535 [Muribaculaceae bacterium]|nr:hypothetical protein [Muribaculaceae bacterium]
MKEGLPAGGNLEVLGEMPKRVLSERQARGGKAIGTLPKLNKLEQIFQE